MDDRNNTNNRLLPLNLNLEKAKAAIEEDSKLIPIDPAVTIKEFIIALIIPSFLNNRLKASKVGSFGIHSIGIASKAPLLFKDVESIQAKGSRAIREKRIAAI